MKFIFRSLYLATVALGSIAYAQLPHIPPQALAQSKKKVGIFYYLWHGSHGYDSHSNPTQTSDAGQGVLPMPDPKKDPSPYDISQILSQPLGERKWGPPGSFHHWGKPLFDYYVSNDEWVIAKHAQMLADAGVDVVFFDATNGFHYRDNYETVLKVFSQLRTQGRTTPFIAFHAGTIFEGLTEKSVPAIYQNLYARGRYQDLWFYWKGKPLLLADFSKINDPEILNFFTIRQSWAWTRFDNPKHDWFGDGKNMWPWLSTSPQDYGWNEDPAIPEMVPVAAAEHPHRNFGKSHHNGQQPFPPSPNEGLYFQEQWERALTLDPEFIFITQWNEWIAQRFINKGEAHFSHYAGRPSQTGDSVFIDAFDEEYNRDIEPMEGGYTDAYYQQMIRQIRRYKKTHEIPLAIPNKRIQNWKDWELLAAQGIDDQGDILHRNHFGWGGTGKLINQTGRNDLTEAKFAYDPDYLYAYVSTYAPLSPPSGENWMELFFGPSTGDFPHWQGFRYRLHLDPVNKTQYHLQESLGGWQWRGLAVVQFKQEQNQLMLKIPRTHLLDLSAQPYRFQWRDNRQNTEASDPYLHGDALPNAPFCALFQLQALTQ